MSLRGFPPEPFDGILTTDGGGGPGAGGLPG